MPDLDQRSTPLAQPGVGRLYVLAAVLLWSTSGLFVKATTFDAWPGILLAFWRAAFAGLILLPFVRRPRWRPALVPMAIFFTLMNVTYLSAMTLTTAANAIWLQSTAPLWVFVIGVFILGEAFDRRDLVPLACGIAGIATILSCEFVAGTAWGVDHGWAAAAQDVSPTRIGSPGWGVAMGLAAGVSYAGVVICLGRLRSEDAVWLVALNHLVAALVMLPYAIYQDRWPTWPQLGLLAAFGGVQMAIPYVLFARGLSHISGQEATGIGLLEPVLVPIWVVLVWGEKPAVWTLAGGGFILAGLILRYTRRLPNAKPEIRSTKSETN